VSFKLVWLAGDGIGPEITRAARQVLDAVAARFRIDFAHAEADLGGVAIDRHGDPFPAPTRKVCAEADSIFLAAVGGPKWDVGTVRPEGGLLALRKMLGLYANIRPTKTFKGLESRSPLTPDRAAGVDMVIIRELTGGLYFGAREEGVDRASDLCAYTKEEVERVARVAFRLARGRRGKVTSVDKANVLATGRLWRAAVSALHAREFSDVELEHALVDSTAMKLIQNPAAFDVMLTENMFGDILSDEASVLGGSIGLAPSASLGAGKVGLYEPIHGSAPDIAGRDIANPSGSILSLAMMLRESVGHEAAARATEKAVETAILDGIRTRDLGGSHGCAAFAAEISARVATV
jgi:3-isopropylmalate dehydrogenase